MKILIIEPYTDGHRAVYAARIIRGALARGHQVVFATLDQSITHEEYRTLADIPSASLAIVKLAGPGLNELPQDVLRREFVMWRVLSSLYNASKPETLDTVFISYLDYCLHFIALFGSPFGKTPFAGIVMKPKFHHARIGINTPAFRSNRVKAALFTRFVNTKHLKVLYSIDETLVSTLSKESFSVRQRLRYIPDPCDMPENLPDIDRINFRQANHLDRNAPVILVYGWLDERKGIQFLLPALSELLTRNIRVNVLLVGRQDTYVQSLLDEEAAKALLAAGLLSTANQYVSSDHETEVFLGSDIVWLGYKDFFMMSGVMVQSGMAGLPVIASNQGLTAWLTEQFHTGLIVNIADQKSISKAVVHLVQDETLRKSLGANASARYAGHSVENFLEAIFVRLENPDE